MGMGDGGRAPLEALPLLRLLPPAPPLRPDDAPERAELPADCAPPSTVGRSLAEEAADEAADEATAGDEDRDLWP